MRLIQLLRFRTWKTGHFEMPHLQMAVFQMVFTVASGLTVHLNGKNLSTNSSWDFDGVVDTMDPYWFVPDKYFFPCSYLSRWHCNSLQELFKKVVKIKSRQHFQAKKTSATPKFCKRNFSRMLRFGNMNILSTPAPIFRVPKILVRYVWGEKFPSGKNK